MVLRKLIFDTSAINKLGADTDRDAIIRTLGLLYVVGITETSFFEVIATEDDADQIRLLDVLKHLLSCGKCVMPFNWIVEEQARAYQHDAANFDWRRLNVRVRLAEEEIARQRFLHDLSEQTRREMKLWDKQFQQIFRDAKPAFQRLFMQGQPRPSVRELTEKLMGEGGAHLDIGADLFERAAGTRATVETVKDFIARCPPFQALLVSLCLSQYDRCIRDEKKQSLGKAGRNDIFSAVYLAYCQVFVTNDDGHWKAMKAVAEIAGINTSVLTYQGFRAGLVGLR